MGQNGHLNIVFASLVNLNRFKAFDLKIFKYLEVNDSLTHYIMIQVLP